MSVVIYTLDGEILTEGLQSSLVCDEAIGVARQLAVRRRETVVVEDFPACECYEIDADGNRTDVP